MTAALRSRWPRRWSRPPGLSLCQHSCVNDRQDAVVVQGDAITSATLGWAFTCQTLRATLSQ
jgi:hypothetical protein